MEDVKITLFSSFISANGIGYFKLLKKGMKITSKSGLGVVCGQRYRCDRLSRSMSCKFIAEIIPVTVNRTAKPRIDNISLSLSCAERHPTYA